MLTTISILGLVLVYSIAYDYFLFRVVQKSRAESGQFHKSRGS